MRNITLATKLTIARILLVPAFLLCILEAWKNWPADIRDGWRYLSLLIFAFSVLTDFLDGLAARRRGERTPLGSFLDPLADKLIALAAFTTLAVKGPVPTWTVVVVYARDILVVMGWGIGYFLAGSAEVRPSLLGKIHTGVEMAAIFGVLVSAPPGILRLLFHLLIASALASVLHYVITGTRRLKIF